ncbi:MAG TPA: MBOAT family protein [Myxococcota bacterium]|nr:MBOAT family protein [Myxococcota bacterium]
MIFSSFEFVVFFGIVLLGIWSVSTETARRNLLLVASYIFYGWWDWRFCLLLAGTTIIDYFAAIQVEEATDPRKKRRWLLVSLCSNLGVLAFFKYTNFFLASLSGLFRAANLDVPTHLGIILPIGLSFFTFQSMSYSIDVYRGNLPATRRLRDFALFVAFFPQLVAGPITRASVFLPQFKTIHPLRLENLRLGLQIFLRGFIKKLIFADRLAIFVDPVFSQPALYSSATVWSAVVAYAFQIYYDFSGYTDMARGVAKSLGFQLPENFRHPYISLNVTEFWRRWHITLSTWLRDYLYIPLGGNRGSQVRTYFNLMTTMLLGGLWHGASWTFVAWGGLHGAALVVHRFFIPARPNLAAKRGVVGTFLSWLATFIFVLVCWVFFRASSFSIALTVLEKMAFIDSRGIDWFYVQAMTILGIATMLHIGTIMRNEKDYELELTTPVAWAIFCALLVVMLYCAPIVGNPFIYFQF